MQQIASATQFLHECGLIHSNISSHAVLIRESPFAAKLSSFELTTEILPREALGKVFIPFRVADDDTNLLMNGAADAPLAEKYYKLSKSHFANRCSLPKCPQPDDNDPRLPHSIAYRRMFSMHFYQPPELLIPSNNESYTYVLPSTRSDIFALALLLWESLNHCVPFVIFNHDELIQSFNKNDAQLPLLDKSSIAFFEIFDSCLRVNACDRLSDVSVFISMLLDLAGESNKLEGKQKIPDIVEPAVIPRYAEAHKNFKDAKLSEKLPEKIYFTKSKVENGDIQRRSENALTAENLLKMGLKDSSRISDSIKSSELEAHMMSISQQPGILQDDTLMRIKQTVNDQRVFAPTKPGRYKEEASDFDASKRSLGNSTMYQSFFDFNRLHTPKIDKDVIYGRTSTLKKRVKVPDERDTKKSVKGLFEREPKEVVDKPKTDEFDKMNSELNQIVQEIDFMSEIVQELNDRQKSGLSSFLNRGMANNLHEQSQSFDDLNVKALKSPEIKRSGSDNVGEGNSYRFTIGDFDLPRTPIARKNKIRRNAWLSDSKKPSGGKVLDIGLKQNKSGNDVSSINNSPDGSKLNRKQFNVSIKIHHNDLDGALPQKSNNVSQSDSSINIRLFPQNHENVSPLIKINNVELNNSRYQEDLNKKYYPMMPEMLSVVNKRDRSFLQLNTTDNEEGAVARREVSSNQEVDEKVIVPVRTSVREAVKFIESTFKSPDVGGSSPVRLRQSTAQHDDLLKTPTVSHEETQTDIYFTPTAGFPKDDVSECLAQASESIQALNEIYQPNQVQLVNKHLDNVLNPTPKKITTKVTVNMKKISRRSSDVEHLKQVQEQSRHSICNNAELIKRIQMHFKTKDPSLRANKKNDAISASCSSLVSKEPSSEVTKSGKCPKYFCRNCGFTMLPVEVLQKLKGSGRLSIASGLAESLQSIKQNDEGSQAMAMKRTCHPIFVRTQSPLIHNIS